MKKEEEKEKLNSKRNIKQERIDKGKTSIITTKKMMKKKGRETNNITKKRMMKKEEEKEKLNAKRNR